MEKRSKKGRGIRREHWRPLLTDCMHGQESSRKYKGAKNKTSLQAPLDRIMQSDLMQSQTKVDGLVRSDPKKKE